MSGNAPVIVVGLVPTAEGWAALGAAIAEADRRDARLIVINSSHGGARLSAEQEREIEAMLIEADRLLQGSGRPYDLQQFVMGENPAHDLIDTAVRHHAELIVLGLRRRSTVGKLLLGSTAQRILMFAPCDVLCTRAGG